MTKYEKCKIYLLSLFVIGFLFCFYELSKNGRYVSSEHKTLDSRTGEVYYYGAKEKIRIDDFKERESK